MPSKAAVVVTAFLLARGVDRSARAPRANVIDTPEKMTGRKLFITTRGDRNDAGLRLRGIQAQFERAPGPKEIVVLDRSAHGQFIFDTAEGERLMREILRFLSAP
jgi:hypothetical protein